uniref:Uncharacterized protein n=1 Tax=Trichogramma kaykai TaxID=54128 RepID=A0ABD2WE19_9HYME
MSRGGLVIDPKRKRVRSPEINSTNKKTVNVLTNYWLSSTVKLTNRFEKLGEVVENDQTLREKRIEINRTTSSQKQDQNGNFSSEFSSPRNQRRTNVSYANATANVNGSNSAHNLQADDNTGSVNQQENIVNNNKLEVMMAQLLCRMDTMMNLLTCLINKIGNGK